MNALLELRYVDCYLILMVFRKKTACDSDAVDLYLLVACDCQLTEERPINTS